MISGISADQNKQFKREKVSLCCLKMVCYVVLGINSDRCVVVDCHMAKQVLSRKTEAN
jgi:hypothetical protein